jgi:hypothetical protein
MSVTSEEGAGLLRRHAGLEKQGLFSMRAGDVRLKEMQYAIPS